VLAVERIFSVVTIIFGVGCIVVIPFLIHGCGAYLAVAELWFVMSVIFWVGAFITSGNRHYKAHLFFYDWDVYYVCV